MRAVSNIHVIMINDVTNAINGMLNHSFLIWPQRQAAGLHDNLSISESAVQVCLLWISLAASGNADSSFSAACHTLTLFLTILLAEHWPSCCIPSSLGCPDLTRSTSLYTISQSLTLHCGVLALLLKHLYLSTRIMQWQRRLCLLCCKGILVVATLCTRP